MNEGARTPGSMLEIYMEAVANETGDDLLDQVNLGVGNYTEAEYWQQMQTFREGLYADSSMTEKVIERAILETKKGVVDAIFEEDEDDILTHVDYPPPEPNETKEEYLEEHMDEVWRSLGYTADDERYAKAEHQAWLVSSVTGLSMDWTPPHWRMLKARHEGSRSKAAHLLDNVFGRPPEPEVRPMEDFQ